MTVYETIESAVLVFILSKNCSDMYVLARMLRLAKKFPQAHFCHESRLDLDIRRDTRCNKYRKQSDTISEMVGVLRFVL